MVQDWDIKPRADACGQCQVPFADRQPYYALLVFGNEGYQRSDFCEACWDAKRGAITPYSLWKGIFRLPPPEPEEPLKKETAESLLRRLMEDEDPSKGNVIYILAVMLERKRILIERDVQTTDQGAMTRVYEHRKTGETFVVPDPRLRLDQLETVQQQVIAMLGTPEKQPPAPAGGEASAGGPAAAAPSATPS
jgi:hypothetical protein